MSRKAVSIQTQRGVLVRSRRRCCMCYGLDRDITLKSGQIAHLDKDNTNNGEDNLVFLCLPHHDQYDTKASQSKNFLMEEIIHFRDELYRCLDKMLSIEVHFGAITVPRQDPYAGHYVRILENIGSAAEIIVTPIPDSPAAYPRYAITGNAYWGAHREYGPNIGEVAFIGTVSDGVIEYTSWLPHLSDSHLVRLIFRGKRLIVEELNWIGVHGMGVTFGGEYERS